MEQLDVVLKFIELLVLPIVGYAIYELRKLRESVETLNVSMKGTITRLEDVEKSHDHRITRLENAYDGPDRRRH